MDVKKNIKADLESKKGIILQLSVIFILIILIFVFEWGFSSANHQKYNNKSNTVIELEMTPIITPEKPKPPLPKITENIEIIENNNQAEESDFRLDIEVEEYDLIDIDYNLIEPDEEPIIYEEVFIKTEIMPNFPGGRKALLKYIAKEIKYPEKAKENGIEGRVFIRFIVNKDGNIEDAYIIRGIDELIDKEALKVIENMPKWKPGMQSGKPVSVWYTVPITFRLN